ncbi:uncharacterized protein F5Z01DRAFT_634361 [Emericellopsis atlantica]|uniref:Uncharacterized protein n=1 Tax=Emericellopsis atlantica TaxID=2614577 RepID=A0A9P7ZRB9_9HYPO|nr:uncharacterized protein F5Z01DRAFT_634361 [Emericellopsis atlantica]KAG9256795.1 hypothetical protein F5Z01DRAFT_634361 [Emericellopsis atlantica]
MSASLSIGSTTPAGRKERRVLPDELPPERKQAHRDLHTLLYSLPLDPLGIVDVGKDGVLRSLTHDRKVVAAVPLEPRLIKAYLDLGEWNAEAEAHFRGVDGTKVPRPQWDQPDSDMLPSPLEGSPLDEAKRLLDETDMSLDEFGHYKGEQAQTDTRGLCPIVVMSDHKILRDDK